VSQLRQRDDRLGHHRGAALESAAAPVSATDGRVITIWIPCRGCYRLIVAAGYSVPRPICADCEQK
jgi:hypothetical protein